MERSRTEIRGRQTPESRIERLEEDADALSHLIDALDKTIKELTDANGKRIDKIQAMAMTVLSGLAVAAIMLAINLAVNTHG